jgi:hypothetical protein
LLLVSGLPEAALSRSVSLLTATGLTGLALVSLTISLLI